MATAACAATPEPEPGLAQVESAVAGQCPVPEDCGSGNGGGVYTDENGYVGIGPNQFMITHFINNGSSVSFAGRYNNGSLWLPGTGTVTGAHYQGVLHPVLAISESFTIPTFNLGQVGDVTGPEIVYANKGFILHITLDNDLGDFDLQFDAFAQEQGNNVTVREANMRWRSVRLSIPWTQYCQTADQLDDPIVFQGGIGVHPVTADLMYNSAYVTAGCRHGGMASVRIWGYAYRPNTATADLFKAALHMKRASYCGDRAFYTISGTEIDIKDTASPPVNNDPVSPIEAVWGADGATCANLQYLRHGDVQYGGAYFDGKCRDANGTVYRIIPSCSATGSLTSSALNPIRSGALLP